ncbi:MAG: hypothetical protein HOE75_10335 [Chloroflexi bacterium]|nr:hypothetical protein [Chloroflexota bacterium]MBT4074069.1 hypothetical protein [Chloroflexota bacterium]
MRNATRRFSFIAVIVGAAFLVACGSGDDLDTDVAAQATNAPASQPTATTIGDGSSSGTSPTPNPTSVNELVFAPDLVLPRANGGTLNLADAYAQGNTVLVFYRGYF